MSVATPLFDPAFHEALTRWSAPSLNVKALTPELRADALQWLCQHRLQVTIELWQQVAGTVRDRLVIEHAAFLWLLNASREERVQYFRDPKPFHARIKEARTYEDESHDYPTQGWLCDYLDYTAEHEAPELFHFWVGATILSAALCRNVAVNFDTFWVYPNLYTLLVAPTGVCRKSTAINLGVALLRAALQDDRLVIFGGKATPESIVTAIRQETVDGHVLRQWSYGFIAADELFHFLGRQSYNEGLVALLTTLYDCRDQDSVNTLKRGREVLWNIYFTTLFGSTPKWLRLAIPPDSVGAGFVPRFIMPTRMVVERIVSRPTRSRHQFEQRGQSLVKFFTSVLSMKPRQIELDADAHQARDAWYIAARKEGGSEDELTEGFAARRDVNILKTAMLLGLAENLETRTISLRIWEQARQLIRYTESTMGPALEAIGTERSGELQQRLLGQLVRRGGKLTHRQAHQLNSRNAKGKDVRDALQTLASAGMIVELREPDHHYVMVPRWEDRE